MENNSELIALCEAKAKQWLTPVFDADTQKAVKEIAGKVEAVLVIGSKNSSNSKQLKETALKAGVPQAFLIDDASELDWKLLGNAKKIGITAGASAPEYLIEDLLYQLRRRYDKIKIIDAIVEQEKVDFKL